MKFEKSENNKGNINFGNAKLQQINITILKKKRKEKKRKKNALMNTVMPVNNMCLV